MKRKIVGNRGRRFRTVREETSHYNAVLIEDLKDQFKFVAEKVGGMEESLKAQMTTDKAELKQEIVDTRKALTMRIDNVRIELKEEIRGVRTELKKDIADVRTELSETRVELSETRVELSETRVELSNTRTELSKKIDRIHDIVASHDESIALLQQGAGGR